LHSQERIKSTEENGVTVVIDPDLEKDLVAGSDVGENYQLIPIRTKGLEACICLRFRDRVVPYGMSPLTLGVGVSILEA
jgi:hypothetical protein